jgi:hypothetical protein
MGETPISGGGTDTGASSASFADAFVADASPASGPSEQSTTPVDAAVPPSATEATPDDRSPFIPRDRFDSVNKRMQDAEAFKQQYEWAKDLNRDEVRQLIEFRQSFAADPVSTLQAELAALANHPVYGPQLRSLHARNLAAGRVAQQAPEPQVPEQRLPTIQLEDGQQIDLQHLKEQIRRETLAEAEQKFQPAMDAAQKFQQAEQLAVAQQQAHAFASGFLPELRQLPQFKEHEADIKSALAATKLETDHPAEVKAAVLAIYNRLVLPKLSASAETRLLDTLQQKAAASSSVNPGSAGASTPRSPRSFSDASLVW